MTVVKCKHCGDSISVDEVEKFTVCRCNSIYVKPANLAHVVEYGGDWDNIEIEFVEEDQDAKDI